MNDFKQLAYYCGIYKRNFYLPSLFLFLLQCFILSSLILLEQVADNLLDHHASISAGTAGSMAGILIVGCLFWALHKKSATGKG
ncbi:hypothetical protein [Bacillus sp. SJS]|uniref:hypothetical protein n=1 Tax=Bacillus sp. SJS TaxID=1423321 RepID=UPI0004DCC2B7|nr:hypothetical protein [Bacillus sp. SJS]KZZ85292.1 hypothetical protein AS29_006830 [Bacillus sp. SJS]